MIYAHIHNNKIEIIESTRDAETLRKLRKTAHKPLKGELLTVKSTDIPKLVSKGDIPTPTGYKFDGVDMFTAMTMEEKYTAKIIDKSEYNEYAISQRKAEYAETDALYMEITYDAMIAGKKPDYTPWLEAKKAVKNRNKLIQVEKK